MTFWHGAPTNALELNRFTERWRSFASGLPRPEAILCISAHWQTPGNYVTGGEKPRTIHDFYGFPQQLYEVNYDSPGSEELAARIANVVGGEVTEEWGLDHGSWSVLTHLYPQADIPVLQLSMPTGLKPEEYFALGSSLKSLRDEGVFVWGSGNIVHNLRTATFADESNQTDWALRFDERVKKSVIERDFQSILSYDGGSADAKLAVNSAEHFKPLFYILGMIRDGDELTVFNDEVIYGTLSMTSYSFGPG